MAGSPGSAGYARGARSLARRVRWTSDSEVHPGPTRKLVDGPSLTPRNCLPAVWSMTTSSYSRMASPMLSSASRSVAPREWQPGKPGTTPQIPPRPLPGQPRSSLGSPLDKSHFPSAPSGIGSGYPASPGFKRPRAYSDRLSTGGWREGRIPTLAMLASICSPSNLLTALPKALFVQYPWVVRVLSSSHRTRTGPSPYNSPAIETGPFSMMAPACSTLIREAHCQKPCFVQCPWFVGVPSSPQPTRLIICRGELTR